MSAIAELPEQRDQLLLRKIYRRWVHHAAFRNSLMSDPKRVLREEFGFELAEGVAVFIHSSRSAKEWHLVMPFVPSELGDAELDAVNDGRRIVACSSQPPGSTCWNTPNCPTMQTCGGNPC